jgi:hypothetical protein
MKGNIMTVLASLIRGLVCSAAIGTFALTPHGAAADGAFDCPVNTYLAGGYETEDLLNMIEAAALETQSVPANLATSLAEEVSGVQPELVGSDCRIGLFQLSGADLQQRLGLDPNLLLDPNINARVGLLLLADSHRLNGGDWMAAAQELTGREDLVLHASVSSPNQQQIRVSDKLSFETDAGTQTTQTYSYAAGSDQFPVEWIETPSDRRAARLSNARMKFRTALATKMQQDQRAASAWPKQYRYD